MSFRASLKNLIHRDPAASLRERAADLRASIPAPMTPAPAPASVEQVAETGAEPAPQVLREQDDAVLLALAPLWEAAVDLYQQRMDEENQIGESASSEGWPGAAPDGAGPEWRVWFQQKENWRERTGMDAAEEASEEAGTALHKIEMQIAALPAASLAGLKLKARVAQRNDDIAWPDELGTGLVQDLLAFGADDDHTATVEEAASLDFTAYAFDTPTRDPSGWMKEFTPHSLGMHIADRTLRMSNPELVAFIQKGGERDAEVPTAKLEALTCAQKTLEGWGKLLDLARDRYLVAGSSAVLSQDAETDAEAEDGKAQAQPEEPRATFSLVTMLDLASATMTELQTVREVAQRIGDVAYAQAWGPRCQRSVKDYGASDFNDAGKLVQWIGDALTDVESAVNKEVRRRRPTSPADRETRLEILAPPVIQNGDADEIEAFARELLGHAEAERAGR